MRTSVGQNFCVRSGGGITERERKRDHWDGGLFVRRSQTKFHRATRAKVNGTIMVISKLTVAGEERGIGYRKINSANNFLRLVQCTRLCCDFLYSLSSRKLVTGLRKLRGSRRSRCTPQLAVIYRVNVITRYIHRLRLRRRSRVLSVSFQRPV